MKISILLPYKENFSPRYAGAVSLLVNDSTLKSRYRKNITVYGSTDFKEKFHPRYKNISFNKYFFESSNIKYTDYFLKHEEKYKSDLIEIHNRPAVFNYIMRIAPEKKIILYFHNDPLSIRGSITKEQRINILKNTASIIFVSEWTKKRFFQGINYYKNNSPVHVVYPSVNRKKFNKRKEKRILFVGKLNYSKGFDLFCNSVVKILDKYPAWKAFVIGDEPRAKIDIFHDRLYRLGFLPHAKVLQHYDKACIAVGCSKWDEPLGRIGLESSSRGCATIVSNKGGLPETITNGIILNELTQECLFSVLEKLIVDSSYRKKICSLSYKNFKNNLSKTIYQIDRIRDSILFKKKIGHNVLAKENKLRIMHVTNFAERHDGRLYFVSIGQKLSNGFIRLGHSVLNYSDRDIMRIGRNPIDLYGKRSLNKKLISAVDYYNPNILLLGHADLIDKNTLERLKEFNKSIKIVQWFEDPLNIDGPDYYKNKEKVLDKLEFIDNTFVTTSPDVLDFNVKKKLFHYMPIPVDKSVERLKIFESTNIIYDLFFAMSHGVNRGVLKFGKIDERENFLEILVNMNPTIKFDIYGLNGRQPIWAEDFFQIISKSSMALNLSRGDPKKYYTSNRLASLLGNGLLTFIDEKTKFNDFFSDNEMVFYKNINDLSEKIQKYAVDEILRKKIAKKGWNKYHNFFNSTIVAKYMIDIIFGNKSKKRAIWE